MPTELNKLKTANERLLCTEILSLAHGDPRQGDHKNGDTLDNQRPNLRITTNAENGRNRRRHRDNASGFKGVHWNKPRQRWQARITIDGQLLHLGHRHTAKAAFEELYVPAALKHFGEFACFA